MVSFPQQYSLSPYYHLLMLSPTALDHTSILPNVRFLEKVWAIELEMACFSLSIQRQRENKPSNYARLQETTSACV